MEGFSSLGQGVGVVSGIFLPSRGTIPTTPRNSTTAAIQLAPRSTGARWECGEQMLSPDRGLNRGAKIVVVGYWLILTLTQTTAGHQPDHPP